jgi:hypothetical protein
VRGQGGVVQSAGLEWGALEGRSERKTPEVARPWLRFFSEKKMRNSSERINRQEEDEMEIERKETDGRTEPCSAKKSKRLGCPAWKLADVTLPDSDDGGGRRTISIRSPRLGGVQISWHSTNHRPAVGPVRLTGERSGIVWRPTIHQRWSPWENKVFSRIATENTYTWPQYEIEYGRIK